MEFQSVPGEDPGGGEVSEPSGPVGENKSLEDRLLDMQAQVDNCNSMMLDSLRRLGVALSLHRESEVKYEVAVGMHRECEAKHAEMCLQFSDTQRKLDAVLQQLPAYEMDHLFYGGRHIRVLAEEILNRCSDGTRGRPASRNIEETATFRNIAFSRSTPIIERVFQHDFQAMQMTFLELIKNVIVSRHATAHYQSLPEMEDAVRHATAFIIRNQVYCDNYLRPQAWVVNHFYYLKAEFGFMV